MRDEEQHTKSTAAACCAVPQCTAVVQQAAV